MLLHLALLPGGISLLGHLLNNSVYISSAMDPRVGISLLEMAFMGGIAVAFTLSNRQLFLWRFLSANHTNKFIFSLLFINQFVAPVVVAFLVRSGSKDTPRFEVGLELFVMLAGVFATLSFLWFSAYTERRRMADADFGRRASDLTV